ncbi:MAG: hypothetical protein LBT22_02280 [Peptococcaceae bacterium]|jgi:hypothetical protein|nr:hypothetical protein [Peptococcaceae bacterium]
MGENADFRRLAILRHQIEAQLLEEILQEQNIPYYIKTLYSDAYGGLFQVGGRWGALYAPRKFQKEIDDILEDLRNFPTDQE